MLAKKVERKNKIGSIVNKHVKSDIQMHEQEEIKKNNKVMDNKSTIKAFRYNQYYKEIGTISKIRK